MNESKITTRYAKALFKLAQEQNLLDTIKKDLDLVNQAAKIDQFKQFVNSPIIPQSKKIQVFKDLFENKVHQYTLQFLILLVENRREHFIDIIILDFYRLYRKALNITEVELTTAVDLDDNLKKQFIEILKRVTQSKQVDLHHKVNPQIIGGFILRIEDKQLDTSVATQLRKLKKHLTDETS